MQAWQHSNVRVTPGGIVPESSRLVKPETTRTANCEWYLFSLAIQPRSGGTRAVSPCNLAWNSVNAETSGLSGTIITGVTPIRRAW